MTTHSHDAAPPHGSPAHSPASQSPAVHSPAAHAPADPSESLSPVEHWEQRYAGRAPIWSGRVNETTAGIVRELTPGDALDLGCGEGGDVLWLAEQGWRAHGLDISPTAVGRGRDAAADRGLENATFAATDLSVWQPAPDSLDLVTASFFQSMVELDRVAILRRAASALRRDGHLVVVSHAAPPSWVSEHPGKMVDVHEERAQLALPKADWAVEVAEERPRAAKDPEGNPGQHLDAVLVLRRR